MQFLQSTFAGVIARHPLPAGGDAASTAPVLPWPLTTPPRSPCHAQHKRSTTRDRWYLRGSHCFPETSCSTACPATSTMWACTSAQGRWCTHRRSVNPFRSVGTAGMATTTLQHRAQLSILGCRFSMRLALSRLSYAWTARVQHQRKLRREPSAGDRAAPENGGLKMCDHQGVDHRKMCNQKRIDEPVFRLCATVED